MKANRRFVNGDDAVSPVIAVILMVAITVVLAATVYLWVSGFGSNQQNIISASFGAKAVDLPWSNTDSDTSDDALLITFVSGPEDFQNADITLSVDGVLLTWDATAFNFRPGGGDASPPAFAVGDMCTTSPGGDSDSLWERGAVVYLIDTATNATLANECDGVIGSGASELDDLGSMDGIHQLAISVKGQIVLDSSVEVHDNAGL